MGAPIVAWTERELEILAELYPAGGSSAVAKRLPHRSRYSICRRAFAEGVRYEVTRPDLYPLTDEELNFCGVMCGWREAQPGQLLGRVA